MNPSPHKASIDALGNIMLPGAHARVEKEVTQPLEQKEMQEGVWYSPPIQNVPKKQQQFSWDATEDEKIVPTASKIQKLETIAEEIRDAFAPTWTAVEESLTHVRDQLQHVTSEAFTESVHQYSASLHDTERVSKDVWQSIKTAARTTWSFLAQPVWVPGRKMKPVQHGRGVLFLLDTVRFGGTFASIFVLLFTALNYQSFWAIAQSYVDPLAEVTGIKNTSGDLDHRMAEKLKRIPTLAVAGQSDGGILDFLPVVGPPDDRLIIPKLDLNVPIVIPPNDALLREDWKKLEEDIQFGLQDGVIHYPGTARPGQAGNFFITGHSSYFPWAPGAFKSVFARLHELKVGDEYWVYYGGDQHRYVVQEKREIKPSDVTVLDQPVNKRIATLMTCTPVGTTLRRLIIIAQEVDPTTGLALEVGQHQTGEELPRMKAEMLPI